MKDAGSIYTFSNIRYANPPTRSLRWAPPQAPDHEPTLQNGATDRICFQAQPAWQMTILGPWMEAWTANDTESFYKQFPRAPALPPVPANLSELFPALLPGETEDCLFLDVHVPKEVFHGDERGAAVWLWIHGGGLMFGSKNSDPDCKGLLARSREGDGGPVIVVSINYRV